MPTTNAPSGDSDEQPTSSLPPLPQCLPSVPLEPRAPTHHATYRLSPVASAQLLNNSLRFGASMAASEAGVSSVATTATTVSGTAAHRRTTPPPVHAAEALSSSVRVATATRTTESSWFSAGHLQTLALPRGISHVRDDPTLHDAVMAKKLTQSGLLGLQRDDHQLQGRVPPALACLAAASCSATAPPQITTTLATSSDASVASNGAYPLSQLHAAESGGLGSSSRSSPVPQPLLGTSSTASRSVGDGGRGEPAGLMSIVAGGASLSSSLKGSAPASAPISPRAANFTIMRRQVLGTGAFGTVYKTFDNVSGRQAAVKECVLRNDRSRNGNLEEEFAILKKLHHPNIVSVYDFRIVPESGVSQIFMEWVPGGSVRATMKQTGFRLHENVIRRFGRDALKGLDYLHRAGVVWRDGKPSNFLLSSDGSIKLSDFGCSRVASEDGICTSSGVVGTIAYMDPSVVRSGVHTFKSDIYSFAASLLELATNAVPWSQVLSKEQFGNAVSLMFYIGSVQPGNHHPPIPQHLSADLQRVMVWCFSFDPEERPTAAQLLADPYFHNVEEPWEGAEPLGTFQELLADAHNKRRGSLSSEENSSMVVTAPTVNS